MYILYSTLNTEMAFSHYSMCYLSKKPYFGTIGCLAIRVVCLAKSISGVRELKHVTSGKLRQTNFSLIVNTLHKMREISGLLSLLKYLIHKHIDKKYSLTNQTNDVTGQQLQADFPPWFLELKLVNQKTFS